MCLVPRKLGNHLIKHGRYESINCPCLFRSRTLDLLRCVAVRRAERYAIVLCATLTVLKKLSMYFTNIVLLKKETDVL